MTQEKFSNSSRPKAEFPGIDGEALRRRSQRILYLKIILPTIAIGLVFILGLWPAKYTPSVDFPLHVPSVSEGSASYKSSAAEASAIDQVTYYSVDDHGQPLEISAERIVERSELYVDIIHPKVQISLAKGETVQLTAGKGVVNRKSKTLALSDSVYLSHSGGYELNTSKVQINLAQGTATGSDPLNGKGPEGLIQAEGFVLQNKANPLLFKGPLTLTLKGTELPDMTLAAHKLWCLQPEYRYRAVGNVVVTALNEEKKAPFKRLMTDSLVAEGGYKKATSKIALNRLTAKGNVVLITDKLMLYADHACYISDQKTVNLKGHIRIKSSEHQLTGETAQVDLQSETYTIQSKTQTASTQNPQRVTVLLDPKTLV